MICSCSRRSSVFFPVDQLKFDSILFFWAGSRTLTFIPHWAKYFDSFAAPPLKEKEFEIVPELGADMPEA